MSTSYRYSLTTRIKEKLLDELLDLQSGEDFLDMGCGAGYFVQRYSTNAPANVYGCDYSFDSLRILRATGKVPVAAASAFEIPFLDGSFDKVLFTDVIEHLEHDELAAGELVRILKPGGCLVVTTPALEGPLTGSRLNLLFHDQPGTPEYHVRPGYSAEGLSTVMEGVGLQVERVEYGTFLFSELATELLKLAVHLLRRGTTLRSQADAERLAEGTAFALYRRFLFPPLVVLTRVEQALFRTSRRGHMLLVKARKPASR